MKTFHAVILSVLQSVSEAKLDVSRLREAESMMMTTRLNLRMSQKTLLLNLLSGTEDDEDETTGEVGG